MLSIIRIQNEPINSNCYLIYSKQHSKCVIIDPGSKNIDQLSSLLESNHLELEYIILTHEHFDHCWGVNSLRKRYPLVKLVCKYECNIAIQSSKGNCSVFYDNFQAFEVLPAEEVIIKDVYSLSCGNMNLTIVSTPGHTAGSISVIVNNDIFTGDALIPECKVVTKLPSANIDKQIRSESFFKTLEGYTIYPGHGKPVKYDLRLFKWIQ